MMLYIDPSSVDMSKAVKDYTPSPGGGSTHPAARWRPAPTRRLAPGAIRRARRARRDECSSRRSSTGILQDIAALRTAPLPTRSSTPPPAAEPPRVERPPQQPRRQTLPNDARPATNERSSTRQRVRDALGESDRENSARCGRTAATSSTPTARSSEARRSSPSIARTLRAT